LSYLDKAFFYKLDKKKNNDQLEGTFTDIFWQKMFIIALVVLEVNKYIALHPDTNEEYF
jgi:hypothetical protein